MPTIYFIRHGETDWNLHGRLQGQKDIPINNTGRGQAKRNGEVLMQALDRPGRLGFVASPLLRTRQTMEIVRAALDLKPDNYDTDDRLKEFDFGDWEGRSWEELKREHREAVRARRADPFNFVVPNGESYALVSARVASWLADIDRDTIVVAHGGIMRCLRGHVMELDPAEIPRLDVPQDRVMVIGDSRIGWL